MIPNSHQISTGKASQQTLLRYTCVFISDLLRYLADKDQLSARSVSHLIHIRW